MKKKVAFRRVEANFWHEIVPNNDELYINDITIKSDTR